MSAFPLPFSTLPHSNPAAPVLKPALPAQKVGGGAVKAVGGGGVAADKGGAAGRGVRGGGGEGASF